MPATLILEAMFAARLQKIAAKASAISKLIYGVSVRRIHCLPRWRASFEQTSFAKHDVARFSDALDDMLKMDGME